MANFSTGLPEAQAKPQFRAKNCGAWITSRRPPLKSATHRRKPTRPHTTRPTPRTRRRNPSPARMSEPGITSTPPNRCHPSDANWCHPADDSAKRSRGQIGATRQSTSRISKSVPPVIPTSSFQPGRRVRIGATRQLRSREHPNWCHPSVEFGRRRRMVPPPCSKKARRPCFGARFSSPDGRSGCWSGLAAR